MNNGNHIAENLLTEKDLGFLPLNRKIFNHFLWEEKREFSRFEAFLDLIKSAQYRIDPNKQIVKGKIIITNRGQLCASLSFLQNRWSWSGRKRVLSFLRLLENDKMIKRETDKETGQTIITLCNYELYNKTIFGEKQQRHKSGERVGNSEGNSNGTQSNKENNVNKEREAGSLSPGFNVKYTQKDVDRFNLFDSWIREKLTVVASSKKQISIDQFYMLFEKYPGNIETLKPGIELIQKALLNINEVGVFSESKKSVYHYLIDWIEGEKRNEEIMDLRNTCKKNLIQIKEYNTSLNRERIN